MTVIDIPNVNAISKLESALAFIAVVIVIHKNIVVPIISAIHPLKNALSIGSINVIYFV